MSATTYSPEQTSASATSAAPHDAAHVLRRKCACGQHTLGGATCAQCDGQRPALRRRHSGGAELSGETLPASVNKSLQTSGSPLDSSARTFFESRFGQDFSGVRVHTDANAQASARDVNAQAYTVGRDIVFGAGQYRPETLEGRKLLAHELTHTIQQGSAAPSNVGALALGSPNDSAEAEADRSAEAVARGSHVTGVRGGASGVIQRTVEMRDVSGASGFARLPELIQRLNEISHGLTYSVDAANHLAYEVRAGGTLSDFDRQMIDFIDQVPVIPLRLTNRRGLMGDRGHGFHDRVEGDDWGSGYVDIDDLLASTPLGMQVLLVHLLRERAATRNYERRIGSRSTDLRLFGPRPEFQRAHRAGIDAEVRMLRDFFGDPSIRFDREPAAGEVFRVYRNDRRDRIRVRVRQGRGREHAGEDTISVEVRTHDGRTLTAEEYRQLLEDERAAAAAAAPAAVPAAPVGP